MRKVTVQRKFNTVKIMRNAIAAYTQNYFAGAVQEVAVAMYANDIANAANALNEFIETANAVVLHKRIMYWDTDVREAFVNVLQYIELEQMVPAHNFSVL